MSEIPIKRKRGRPPKQVSLQHDVRRHIVRTGVEALTESPFSANSIDGVLKRAGVPKGSFYYYFESKEVFGLAVLEQYDSFFEKLLRRTLLDSSIEPLDRIGSFVNAAAEGMAKHHFKRGCAVGNLTQELSTLPESYRLKLKMIFSKWESMLLSCLRDAIISGQLHSDADINALSVYFWTGWEGAVIRAKLSESREPLDIFYKGFFSGLPLANKY